uniref:Uncharacterized protein n=1 Tax=Arundo donax TaxID=35708 RepID=A0A0A9I2P2_ARUDO
MSKRSSEWWAFYDLLCQNLLEFLCIIAILFCEGNGKIWNQQIQQKLIPQKLVHI